LRTIYDLVSSKEADKELRNNNQQTPDVFSFDSGQLPFERMGHDHFELLLADLFTALADDGTEDWFDEACRLNDGADQGRDVILLLESDPVGVIQCKRYKDNVGLPQIIREICKFFMYARIMPQIVPPLGNDFSYYVAVSNNTTAALFEFMNSKGRKRFDDLRDDFEKEALSVRNKSKKLKVHPALKDLDKKQLCDIVWERVDQLKTRLLKKESLSRMIAEYPIIKSNYFKLDSDTTAIIAKIESFLISQGLSSSKNDTELTSSVRTEYINLSLSSSNRFNIGLIQGDILLPFIRTMFKPLSGSLNTDFGSRSVLISAGAKAAKINDWFEINELVKNHPNPMVFSVGCGDVLGSVLLEWRESDDMVWIDPEWEPAPARLYRAGWCWVTNPKKKSHDCYILVENETGDQNYDHANMSLRLAFEDVIVWPTLGNDFTSSLDNAKSLLRRIMATQAEDRSKRANLILASQNIDSIEKIYKSIPDYYAQRSQSPIAISIANSERLDGCGSGIYCATGIFPALGSDQKTRSTPSIFQPQSRVMRRSCNGVLTMTINWDKELIIEFVQGYRLLVDEVKSELGPESLEFHELFKRHPPINDYLECAKGELEQLNKLVQNESIADSQAFTYKTQYGVIEDKHFSLSDMSTSGEYVMQAMQALSYIKTHKNAKWLLGLGGEGHIEYRDSMVGEFTVLAWTNHRYPVRQMEADLFGWARKKINNPNLVVFANARGLVKDKKPSHGRHDITNPTPIKRVITEAEEPSNVYIFDLREVESHYEDVSAPSVEKFMADILDRRKKLDAQ
jgi:hypothetical protein